MPVYALCDANNFYCSCERVFNPALRGVPLYGDMSRRLYEVLQRFSPRVEPYSIDEMFLDLDGLGVDLVDHGRAIRTTILQETKIPTCVGIGETKTKAKLANFLAKKRPEFAGVCDLRDPAACQRLYPTIPLDEVWGIGSASAAKLQTLGLATVADLAGYDVTAGRSVLTVTGARHHGIAGHVLPAALADLAATQGPRRHPDIRGVHHGVGRAGASRLDLRDQGRGEAARASAARLRHDGLYSDQPLYRRRVLQQCRDLRAGADAGYLRADP